MAYIQGGGGGPISIFIDGDLNVGDNQISFQLPVARTLASVRAEVETAPTGAGITVDIEVAGGSTIFSTLLTIDATETDSGTAATPAVLSTTAFSQYDILEINIDVVGSTLPGTKLHLVFDFS